MDNHLSRVIDALPGLVWTTLPDGHTDFINRRWSEYTGLSFEQARGQGWLAAVHPDDLSGLTERWTAIRETRKPGEAEARLRRFDGDFRWFQFSAAPLIDASGQLVRWCGINTDIEDRKRAEAARVAIEREQSQTSLTLDQLTRSERWLRTVIDSIPTTVWSGGPDGRTLFWNKRWQDYAGFTSVVTSDDWLAIIHPDDRERLNEAVGDSVAAGRPGEVETRMRRFDGEYRWFLSRWEPLRDESGSIVSWYGANTDIDDVKRAEALLAGEKRVLEIVAGGHPMPEILEALCRFVESTAAGCHCSVVLVDPSGTRLEHGAAPSLPASFTTSIVGRPVNVDSGPCAMAARLNEQVIAPDLTSETRWAAYAWCPMALAHGLQACWSTPIASAAGKVLGAFAIYYDGPKSPTPHHQSLIGRFTHIASIAVERAQSDATLRRSEESFGAIVKTTPECVKVIARDGTLLVVNAAGVAMSGAESAAFIIGRNFYEFVAPEHRQRYKEFNEQVCDGKKGFLEFDIVNMRGQRHHMETHAAPMRHSDGSIAQLGITRDITARILAEDELRRSETFLAEGEKISATGSFSWRLDTDDIIFSAELRRIFGFAGDLPVTFERIAARVHPEDIPLLSEKIAAARGNSSSLEYEIRLRMPDGLIKYLHTIARPTLNADGRAEYVGAVQDVSQRRLADDALGKARSELAHMARVTTLGALTASIAHEVNQPLSGIVTNASTCLRMLAADPPNVDGAIETAKRTIRDGNRASDVVTRLRALFSKKDTKADPVDLNEATREVIALSLSELQRSRIVLLPELAHGLPPVTGDRVQLQQVILNLLLNASDAMSGVDDRPRQLVVRTEPEEDDRVRLTVQDAGVGFGPHGAERLFEAFYTTKSEGMGIGLSVSRSIIESHQGRLWAASNDGPGATFSFSIPRRPRGVTSARNSSAGRGLSAKEAQQVKGNP